MKSRKHLKLVACAFPAGINFVERLLAGVHDYARKKGNWTFVRLPERVDPSIDWLRDCACEGALIVVHNREAVNFARSLHMPVVNLTAYMKMPEIPTVMVDQEAIGRMAAQHLIERHFSRFAYYGTSDIWYSQLRREAFVETVAAAGGTCDVLEIPSGMEAIGRRARDFEKLDRWLKSLKLPVGIMASMDLRACMITDACHRLGLRVPQDVAVVGVDNGPAAEFNDPPISSVSRNDTQVGWQAASLLDHLMRGGARPHGPVLIHPDQIIARHSTDTFAIEDPRIARAIAYVQKHVHRPFGVEQLIEVANMPRRTFEEHFVRAAGITAYAFINRCRVDHASRLLQQKPKASLTEIAALSGFRDLRRFRIVFRQFTGQSPAASRRKPAGEK
jgi:LacI family transcriptional regulator